MTYEPLTYCIKHKKGLLYQYVKYSLYLAMLYSSTNQQLFRKQLSSHYEKQR